MNFSKALRSFAPRLDGRDARDCVTTQLPPKKWDGIARNSREAA
jgi:hypothetical protein